MKTVDKKIFIIIAVLFILFNILAFVIPSEFSALFWISYVFSILAFVLWGYGLMNFLRKDTKAMSRFYKIPVLYVVNWYLTIQVIIFFIFKFITAIPSWVAIIIESILLGIAVIGCITGESTKKYVEEIDNKVRKKTFFIKELLVEVEMLEAAEFDDSTKKNLHVLAEKIKYSDPMSDDELAPLEEKINEIIKSLKQFDSVQKNNSIESVILLLEERNKKCKLLK